MLFWHRTFRDVITRTVLCRPLRRYFAILMLMFRGKPKPMPFRALRIALVAGTTLAFLLVSNPAKLPAMLLVLPFIGLYVGLYLILLEVVRFLGPDDESAAIVRLRRPRLVAAVLTGFPILLLVLQSIVRLTIWDVLIAFAILLLGYLYVSLGSALSFRR